MNANLTKLIGSAVAIVLAMGSSAFAQNNMKGGNNCAPSCPEPKGGCPCPPFEKTCPCPPGACPCAPFEQGEPLTNCVKFPPAYNAPAGIDVQCSWDVFVAASFLYWNVEEEGLGLGYNTAQVTPGARPLPPNFGLYQQVSSKYKPGFQVGLGMNFDYDNWVGYLEYTWMHCTIDTSVTAPSDFRGTGVLVSPWFVPVSNASGADFYNAFTSVSTSWQLKFDMIDGTLSRPYYQGRNLTLTPYAGARALWIKQNLNVLANTNRSTSPATVPSPVRSRNRSSSWGMGPVAGFLGHWLLGMGFRAEGDMGASVTYTTYTQIIHREDNTVGATSTPSIARKFKSYGALRPMTNMGLGLGWGTYLDRQNYHFDLGANYDFMVFWDQNVLRAMVENGVAEQPNNLTFQGLTLKARFDF